MSDVPHGHVLLRMLKSIPMVAPGETVALPYARAKALVEAGFALYVDPPKGVDAAGGTKTAKAEGLPEGVSHKGGGYYIVGHDDDGVEVLVKGKRAAAKAHASLVEAQDAPDPDPDPEPDPDEGDGDEPDPDPED